MLRDLDSGRDIARRTEELLREADAVTRFPTPVADLIEAAGLTEPRESVLSEAALEGVPDELAASMRPVLHKAHALLDREAKEIHVNPDVSVPAQAQFKRCHEIAHAILPWQQMPTHIDTAATFAWDTRSLFEQEANRAGAELLFQGTLFQQMAADHPVSFASIRTLAEAFGASYHASFRRFVETHHVPMAGLVLSESPCSASPLAYQRKEAVNSAPWTESFDRPCDWPKRLAATPYGFVSNIKTHQKATGPFSFAYTDLNNEIRMLQVELWSNTYNVFALIWVDQQMSLLQPSLYVAGATAT